MTISLKEIKKNFFIEYSKYWLALFVIIFIFSAIKIKNYYFKTNNITKIIKNAVFVGNGVVINSKYVLTSNDIIKNSCIGKFTGKQGIFYVINKTIPYKVVPATINSNIDNLRLLKVYNDNENLGYYTFLNAEKEKYSKKDKFKIPLSVNKKATFKFKKTNFINENQKVFYIGSRSIKRKTPLSGTPVFDKNYVLSGIIKERSSEYADISEIDKTLNKTNIQKAYSVNNIDTIRNFLDKNNITYSIINSNSNINQKKYNLKESVVNIICVDKY